MGSDGRTAPDYAQLHREVRSEIDRGRGRNVSLQLVCNLLTRRVPHYDWFGFYFAVPGGEILVLGPFEGEPTEHVRIPYGRGICGQVAQSGTTFVVDDVSAQGDYLACSVNVQSEIVVPVMEGSRLLGQIDIDSHTRNAFTDDDRTFLEAIATDVAPFFPRF